MLLARHAALNLRASTSSSRIAATQRQPLLSHAALGVQVLSPRASALTRTSSFSTSARSESTPPSSEGKVEALPFQLDPWNARMRARVFAISKSKNSLWGTFILYPLSSLLKYIFGFPGLANYLEAPARVERFEAVYLPYWVIDTNFTIQAKGAGVDKTAEASFCSINSRMPGFDWQPMRSLPLAPPSADEASYEVFEEAHLNGPARAQAEVAEHKLDWDEPEGSEGQRKLPRRATLLPFAVSPLSAPALLHDADAAPLEIKVPRIMAVTEEEMKAGESDMFEPPKPDRIRFVGETLDLDMLAVYPVLLPAYVTRFKPVEDENGEKQEPLIVVQGAWESYKVVDSPYFATGGSVPKHPLEEMMSHKPSWTMQGWTPMVALSPPLFDPAVPLPGSQAPEAPARKIRKRPGSTGKATSSGPGPVTVHNAKQIAAGEMYQAKDTIGHTLLQAQLITAAQKWIEKGDWSKLEQKEREAAEKRTQRNGKVPLDERKNLGALDWEDVRVQRFSEQAEENRAYLEAVAEYLHTRRTHKVLKIQLAKVVAQQEPKKLLGIDDSEEEEVAEADEARRETKPEWLKTWRRQQQAKSADAKGKS